MNGLEEFFDYKNQLMGDLLTNPEIVRLLNDDCTAPEYEGGLVYSQVFPFEYVPDVVEHGRTFICCEVDIKEVMNKTFMEPTLYIWVFTHKSLLRLPEGGVRTDKLASEISRTINGSRYYGLGELNLASVKRFSPIADYQGRTMTFYAKDFNRTYPTGKAVPGNRKGE